MHLLPIDMNNDGIVRERKRRERERERERERDLEVLVSRYAMVLGRRQGCALYFQSVTWVWILSGS